MTQGYHPGFGDVLLCRGWVGCVTLSGEVAEGIQHPRRPLRPGLSLYIHVEIGEIGLLTLLHPWRIVIVDVHAARYEGWTLLPICTTTEGEFPGVLGGAGGRLLDYISTGTARRRTGGGRGDFTPPPPGEGQTYPFSFPEPPMHLR